MDGVTKGGVGGTYGGNPVACAAALATLSILEREVVANGRAAAIGSRVRERLMQFAVTAPLIGEVRGLGAMLAIELVRDRSTREPAPAETQAIIAAARDRGLLLLSAGTLGNVIRLLMPLTISDEELETGLILLGESLCQVGA